MLSYVIAGLVLGGIFAISASGLVITYQSSGVFNFAFSAIAYTVARFYYFLNTQHHWSQAPAGVLAILVLGPVLGLLLYMTLFRLLALCSTLIKVMVTVGISVSLPPFCVIVFGNHTILSAPGLAPFPVKVIKVLGVPVTMDQMIVYACVIVLGVGGFTVLRYTDVGLQVRALVDSPALTSLSGTNPGTMSMGVWVVSTALAGLVGVLVVPIVGLDSVAMSNLMITAFAAVIAAKLRSMPVAAVVGLGMGIINSLVQYFLPPGSAYTADLLTALPFIVMVVMLVVYGIWEGAIGEDEGVGGALDHAIRPQAETASTGPLGAGTKMSWRPAVFGFACLVGLPLLLHGFWVGLLAQGVAYGIIFLSFTLTTGEGGMLWLCQGAFAGGGGCGAALLARDYHLPILLAVVFGGLIAVPIAAVIGFATIRLGDLYVALVTFTFGITVDDLVFNRQVFSNFGQGIATHPPSFAHSQLIQVYLGIIVFVLAALFILNMRRSTSGLSLTAVRTSVNGSRTIGISVLQTKLMVSSVAAFVAGIGGGLLAITFGAANTANYATLAALVWLAVLVTQGIRSSAAAMLGGISQTLATGFALVFLPKVFNNFVPILFGLGAIGMIKFPEGLLTMQARQFRSIMSLVRAQAPTLYQYLRLCAAAYFVVLVTLLATVKHLWWLWLAVSVVIAQLTGGFVVVRGLRRPAGIGRDPVSRAQRPRSRV